MQFHQDLHLVYPGWASESPAARHDIYANFRERYGEQAVRDLRDFFRLLLSDEHLNIEMLWPEESKDDWVISEEGIRRLFKDFEAWAATFG